MLQQNERITAALPDDTVQKQKDQRCGRDYKTAESGKTSAARCDDPIMKSLREAAGTKAQECCAESLQFIRRCINPVKIPADIDD